MSELVPYVFEGQQVRTVVIDGEPWFVLTDVAKVLGYRDANHAGRILRDTERRTHRMGTPNGVTLTVVSEAGLYRLIMRSNQPKAEEFQDWVTGTLLPTLRKTGRYEVTQLTRLELIEMARDAELGRIAAEKQAAELEATTVVQGKELESARPKAAYVDAFINPGEDVTTIGDFAKELGIRMKDLREYLVARKRIYKRVLPRRWSASKQREQIEYEWRYHAGFETWFTLREQPDAPRLHNGQIRMTLYVTPVGKERIRRMLETDPIGGAA